MTESSPTTPALPPRLDGTGKPIADDLDVFYAMEDRPQFDDLLSKVRSLESLAENFSAMHREIRLGMVRKGFADIKSAIEHAKPYAQCPYYPQCLTGCRCCGGKKWVNASVYAVVPPEDR